MAVTLDATVGGTSANSYVTLAEANAIVDTQLNADPWLSADDEDRVRALIMAATRLDQEDWRGVRVHVHQSMAWPRTGLTDQDGYVVEADAIPARLKRAQVKLAVEILRRPTFLADTGLENIARASVGPISIEPVLTRVGGELPAEVRREIAPFLATTDLSVRILRA